MERRIGVAGRQELGVERLVDQGWVDEHGHAIGPGMLTGIHKGDQPAVGVEAVRQPMAPQGVLVGRLDLVGQVIEVPDVGEAEEGSSSSRGRSG
jgi:hypothetical protein